MLGRVHILQTFLKVGTTQSCQSNSCNKIVPWRKTKLHKPCLVRSPSCWSCWTSCEPNIISPYRLLLFRWSCTFQLSNFTTKTGGKLSGQLRHTLVIHYLRSDGNSSPVWTDRPLSRMKCLHRTVSLGYKRPTSFNGQVLNALNGCSNILCISVKGMIFVAIPQLPLIQGHTEHIMSGHWGNWLPQKLALVSL